MRPTISMLLPARGRPANLKTSVASVFELAKKPDDVEVIVRLDDDDPHVQEEIDVLKSFSLCRIKIGAILSDPPLQPVNSSHLVKINIGIGPRLGYSRMHEMYNWCAKNAQGDWLFMWNDDIDMLTQNWDELTREAPLFSVQFPRRDVTKTTDYTLPVIGRPVYEALGHLSMNAYCDAWISDFSAFAGTSVVRDDIAFTHHRLTDATMAQQNDGGKEWHKFTQDEQKTMRRADMDAVIAAPGHAGRFDGWHVEDVFHNVDYINLAAGEMKAKSVILRGRK